MNVQTKSRQRQNRKYNIKNEICCVEYEKWSESHYFEKKTDFVTYENQIDLPARSP